MTTKTHSQRSDSTTALVEAARAPDPDNIPIPNLSGSEILDKNGKQFLADLYRAGADRWSAGDLLLLLEAAHFSQQVHTNRMLMAMVPSTVQHKNGKVGRHPIHVAHFEMVRQLQTLLRDLNIRSKDGASPTQAVTPGSQANRQLQQSDSGSPDWDSLRIQ